MTLLLPLAYVGGLLTILSPCILPVLPFLFTRLGQPFLRGGLPVLLGMAGSFAAVGSLAAVGGGWAVRVSGYGRSVALAVMGLCGLALVLPSLGERLGRPLVGLGGRLSRRGGTSLLLGLAVGLLWAPCAGPILGLVLTASAMEGATSRTALLLLAYGAGAATSLALALLAGGRLSRLLRRGLPAATALRRLLGLAVLLSVGGISLGLDKVVLARAAATDPTIPIEQALLARVPAAGAGGLRLPVKPLPVLGALPPLAGGVQWLNSPPLSREALRGKVVLVDFWTFGCVNCQRTLPYVRAWAAKYRDSGLVVVGVHTPEFAYEKDPARVRSELKRLGVRHPVVLDNDYRIWRAFGNRYWPAHYFIDTQGRIRRIHFGEGDYRESEDALRSLLGEAGASALPGGYVKP
jgi:cytochrome c biogenesis protein CcdA/thiol-disulfide isomerase/thioredoxin